MKRLKVVQNSTGGYNLLNPSQKKFKFALAICDENGILTDEYGRKCMIEFLGEVVEKQDFDYFLDEYDIVSIYERCFEYAKRTWSTAGYKENAIYFAEEMSLDVVKEMMESGKKKLETKIARIEDKIKGLQAIDFSEIIASV